MDQQEIETRFTHHAPKDGQSERYVLIRNEAKQLAQTIINNTPPSREQSEAITNLENAVMWANAAIARRE
jgi:hypothetical protein